MRPRALALRAPKASSCASAAPVLPREEAPFRPGPSGNPPDPAGRPDLHLHL